MHPYFSPTAFLASSISTPLSAFLNAPISFSLESNLINCIFLLSLDNGYPIASYDSNSKKSQGALTNLISKFI